MAQQKYLRRFKALKSRIIMTDELMTMYQNGVKECSLALQKLHAAEGKLAYLDDCIHVHKKELDVLHQEKERFRKDCDKSGEECRKLEEDLATEKDINQHLLTQLQTLQREEGENKALVTHNKELTVERDKWKEMYKKLKRECALRENMSRSRRKSSNQVSNNEASLLPTPLTSPPSSMGSMDNMDLHFFSASSPCSPRSSPRSLHPASRDCEAEGGDSVVIGKERGGTTEVGGELVKCVDVVEGTYGDARSRLQKEEELFGRDSDSDSDDEKSDRLLSSSSAVSDSDLSSSSDEDGVDDLRKLRNLLYASGRERLVTAMDAVEEKEMCTTATSENSLLPSFVSAPTSHDGDVVDAASVVAETVVAAPVVADTVVAASVLADTVVAAPVVADTVFAAPVVADTVVAAPFEVGTVVNQASIRPNDPSNTSQVSANSHRQCLYKSNCSNNSQLQGHLPQNGRQLVQGHTQPLQGYIQFPRDQVNSSGDDFLVELAAADTASSDDGDDDEVSSIFSSPARFAGLSVLSPLPPSPVSFTRILSPFPTSPSPTLSPLPHSPGSFAVSLSPLPLSPIDSHATSLSPLPPSPNNLKIASLPSDQLELPLSCPSLSPRPPSPNNLKIALLPSDQLELPLSCPSSFPRPASPNNPLFASLPSDQQKLTLSCPSLSPHRPSPNNLKIASLPSDQQELTLSCPSLSPHRPSPNNLKIASLPSDQQELTLSCSSLSPHHPSPNNLKIALLPSDQQELTLSCPSLSPHRPSPNNLKIASLPSDQQELTLSCPSLSPHRPSPNNLKIASLPSDQQELTLSCPSLSPHCPSPNNLKIASLPSDQQELTLSCPSLSPHCPSPNNLKIASLPSDQQELTLSCSSLPPRPPSPKHALPTQLPVQSPKRTSNQKGTSLSAESEVNKSIELLSASDVAVHVEVISSDVPLRAPEESSPSLPFSEFNEQGPPPLSVQSNSSLSLQPPKRERPQWTGDVTSRRKKKRRRERDDSPVVNGDSSRGGEGGSCEGVGYGRVDCGEVETVCVMDFGISALPTSLVQDSHVDDHYRRPRSRRARRSVSRVSPMRDRDVICSNAQTGKNKRRNKARSGISSPVRKLRSPPLSSSCPNPSPPSSSSSSSSSPELSVAQQSLVVAMQCPLPLPLWLVSAMTEVQSKTEHCAASGRHFAKKKGGNKKGPISRLPAQNPLNYVVTNLERLVCGHLHLSTVITMFTMDTSIPSSSVFTSALVKFFMECYNPKIEHVLSLFHSQCKNLWMNPDAIDPGDPDFIPALLRPECQIVALLAHMCRLSKCMANILQEASLTLYQAALRPHVKFHKLIAIGRVFTALIRLQADPERLLFFLADLLKKPLLPNEIYIIMSVATIWPAPANKKKCVVNKTKEGLNLVALEEHLMRSTLEVAVLHKYNSEGKAAGVHEAFPKNLLTYYGWDGAISSNLLATSLMKILETSSNVYIDHSTTSQTSWQRPRPSIVAYQIVYCLNLLALCKGWPWTNDFLIGRLLWPILQEWNGGKGQGEEARKVVIKDAVVVCVLRLMGFLSLFGVKQDPTSSSIGQLQRVLLALLKESSSSPLVSLPMQLATVDSLLEMSPPNHSTHALVLGAVREWLKQQETFPWAHVLKNEFKHLINLTV